MIELDGVSVLQGPFALRNISLLVPPLRFAVLLGRTGGGKTTLLEVIAGLRSVRAGDVKLRGISVKDWSPAARNLGYVPQDAAMFTNLTVRENLAFGLNLRRWSPEVITRRVDELARKLDLRTILDRQAVQLSGGEAQRVALGRALAFQPDILLLDEPLSAVDDVTKAKLLDVLQSLRGTITVLLVTHDRQEATALADVMLRLDEVGVSTEHTAAVE